MIAEAKDVKKIYNKAVSRREDEKMHIIREILESINIDIHLAARNAESGTYIHLTDKYRVMYDDYFVYERVVTELLRLGYDVDGGIGMCSLRVSWL